VRVHVISFRMLPPATRRGLGRGRVRVLGELRGYLSKPRVSVTRVANVGDD